MREINNNNHKQRNSIRNTKSYDTFVKSEILASHTTIMNKLLCYQKAFKKVISMAGRQGRNKTR